MGTTLVRKNVKAEAIFEPQPIVVRLAGAERKPEWNEGFRMIPGTVPVERRVSFPVDDVNAVDGKGEVSVAREALDRPIDGFVMLVPLSLTQVQVIAADEAANPSLVVMTQGKRHYVNTVLERNHETGEWRPSGAVSPLTQYFALNLDSGSAAPPAVAQTIFDSLSRAVEMAYVASYREFVVAEARQVASCLAQWTKDNETMKKTTRSGKPTKEAEAAAKVVYAVRFSGNIAALRQHLQACVDWLNKYATTQQVTGGPVALPAPV